MTRHYQQYIGGEFVDAIGGNTLDSVNPATEQTIATFPAGDVQDVDRAVTSARKAFDDGPWGAMKAPERVKFLHRIAEGIEQRADELARIETADSGKPLCDNREGDIPDAAACFDHFAGWASTVTGHTLDPPMGNFFDYTLREPLGVVAGIASWNFPLLNAAWKIAAPLAAGNCVVFKPASDTVLSALVLAQIAAEADLPAGVLNIITGSGTSAGQPLAAHPGTDKISFTGSTPTGRIIGHAAVEDFRCCTLELGGKSPNIVFDDCDLDKAVKGALWAIFFNAGQVCTAGSRLLLQDSIYQVFMQQLIEEASNIQVGDPMDKATRMGPLVSKNQQETVMNFINRARDDGLSATIGGARPDGLDTGYYIQPTIYENVPSDHPLNREEIFGPVLVVHRFKDEQDAIRQANDTPYGLAAGLWTRDLSRAHRLAKRLHAGTVWINTYNFAFTNIPNPGHKHSGLGMELGREGFEAYTRIKNVCIDLDSKPIDYFN